MTDGKDVATTYVVCCEKLSVLRGKRKAAQAELDAIREEMTTIKRLRADTPEQRQKQSDRKAAAEAKQKLDADAAAAALKLDAQKRARKLFACEHEHDVGGAFGAWRERMLSLVEANIEDMGVVTWTRPIIGYTVYNVHRLRYTYAGRVVVAEYRQMATDGKPLGEETPEEKAVTLDVDFANRKGSALPTHDDPALALGFAFVYRRDRDCLCSAKSEF